MNNQQLHYLSAMNIPVWQLRKKDVANRGCALDTLEKKVAVCTACTLHTTRTQTVFGIGKKNARIMIIGQAPGAQEDKAGEPFVGSAGQLLDDMLQAIGLQRDEVYITNIVKCYPASNQGDNIEAMTQCAPFLQTQIKHIEPELIIAVGSLAARHLLQTEDSLDTLRGKIYYYGEKKTPLILTYDPSHLLNKPSDKRKAFQDLLQAQDYHTQISVNIEI